MSKGILYRIRNVFFQKKHDELVVKIKNKQEHLKELQAELNKINHLAEHGILGDRLLDKQIMLEQNVRTINNDISLLKGRYQNKCKKEQPSHSCQDITELGRCAVEHEQKPTNKIEPKFKVGDWLVQNERKNIVNIVNATPLVYKVVDTLGYHHTITNTAIENNYHLWTIQDAKDGDVLCCESGWTCIFKTLVNDETFSSYCFMDKTKWFCEKGSECHTLNGEFTKAYNGEIKPATKEQRDTLMKVMADARYTFDFEKKELKKIEQEWTGEDERNASYICAALECYYRLREERNNTNGQEDLNKARNWLYNKLKSLRPKLHWKPSDEQMDMLKIAVSTSNSIVLDSLYEQLKKLKGE